jgi:pyruvate formate-lyase activating enzyme-like uncharacterized protein
MKTKFDSYATKGLPEGCKYCVKGQKSVLFLGGKCSRNCWYCSLSDSRKKSSQACINERPIKKDRDLIREIKESNSKGVGITGGDPLVYFRDTVRYSKLLKKNFGKDFHIHVYLPLNLVDEKKLSSLSKSIDEVRFHPTFVASSSEELKAKERQKIILASKIFGKENTGIEVPMLPEKKKEIYDFVYSLKDYLGFVNLNEFELSETNFDRVINNYSLNEDTCTVFGSQKAGKWILAKAEKDKLKMKFHLCTAKTKDFHQYRNRLAKHNILPYGIKLKNGNVLYFVVRDNSFRNLLKIRKITKNYFNDKKRKRILIDMDSVLEVYDRSDLKIARIEEQPVFGNEVVELSWIGRE